MAVKIVLSRKGLYPVQVSEIAVRIDIGLVLIQEYMRGYFEPKKFVAWLDAPVEELGGRKLEEENLQVGSASEIRPFIARVNNDLRDSDKRNSTNNFGNTIFRIEGIWKFGKSEAYGFVSINNNSDWKSAYGDIDIDGYPTGEHDDFLDMFWENDEVRDEIIRLMFDNFVKGYKSNKKFMETFDIRWICFASGVPSESEVSAMKAVYYDNDKHLISDLFRTYSEEHKQDVQKSIKREYLVNRAFGSKLFREETEGSVATCQITKLEGGSIMLVGRKSDSFKRLYKKFSKEFLKPLYDELPDDAEVDGALSRVIKKNTSLKDIPADDSVFDFRDLSDEE